MQNFCFSFVYPFLIHTLRPNIMFNINQLKSNICLPYESPDINEALVQLASTNKPPQFTCKSPHFRSCDLMWLIEIIGSFTCRWRLDYTQYHNIYYTDLIVFLGDRHLKYQKFRKSYICTFSMIATKSTAAIQHWQSIIKFECLILSVFIRLYNYIYYCMSTWKYIILLTIAAKPTINTSIISYTHTPYYFIMSYPITLYSQQLSKRWNTSPIDYENTKILTTSFLVPLQVIQAMKISL